MLRSLKHWLRAICLGLVSFLTAAAALAGDLAESENLFFIKRSKNANEVHYDARVENCIWRKPEVDSYWRDLAVGPRAYDEIKFYENDAYGFSVDRLSNTEITIRLRPLPGRAINARLSRTAGGGCRVSTTINIGGETTEFRSVYVYATENAIGFPTVHYIEILGTREGQPVFERIAKTAEGGKLGASKPDASHWRSGAPTWGRR